MPSSLLYCYCCCCCYSETRDAQSDRGRHTGMTEQLLTGKSADRSRDELKRLLARVEGLALLIRLRALSLLFFRLKVSRPKFKLGLRNKLTYLLATFAALYVYAAAKSYLSNLHYDRCLIEQPSLARQLFRPAEDCSICRDVQEVEKISNVDPKLFENRYAYSGRPVVVTDAASNWTAMTVFSFTFFKNLYKDQDANCQFFPYKTEFQSLQDVFNMSASRALLQAGSKPWYVGWSNCDESIGAILREHYDRPYFLPYTAESEKTDWIFMGSPGYGAPMHIDDVEYPSWQAQIRGRKLWILEPPRECHYSCNRLQVTVDPGEIIILDTNKWYHETRIISEDISITIGAEYD